MKDTTKELLIELLRSEFDRIDLKEDYITHRSEWIVDAAKDLGLNELAQDMKNDLP